MYIKIKKEKVQKHLSKKPSPQTTHTPNRLLLQLLAILAFLVWIWLDANFYAVYQTTTGLPLSHIPDMLSVHDAEHWANIAL